MAQDGYDEELARIDASIADLKIRDMAAAKERTQIAGKIQAAQFQRDILAHANQQKKRAAKTARKVRRRPGETTGAPSWAEPGTAHTGPPGEATDGVTTLVDDPPPTERPALPPPPPRRRPRVAPLPPEPDLHLAHGPETSSKSVQNILLGLSALVLGVAAIVFAGATSNTFGRVFILAIATAVALGVAPAISRRGLTSTAETLAAVGLVLLPLTLFALHGSSLFGGAAIPATVFLGVTLLITAVVSFLYAGVTRLAAPRYATVVAVQPVAPLLAYPAIESAARLGAGADRGRAHRPAAAHHGDPARPSWCRAGRSARPVAADRETLAAADARRAGAADYADRDVDPADPADYEDAPARPESLPEEPDLIIDGLTGRRRWRWLPTRIFPGPRPAGCLGRRLGAAGPARHAAVGWPAARADVRPALCRRRGRAGLRGRRPADRGHPAGRGALRPDPGAGGAYRLGRRPPGAADPGPQHRRRRAGARRDRRRRPDRHRRVAVLDPGRGRRRSRGHRRRGPHGARGGPPRPAVRLGRARSRSSASSSPSTPCAPRSPRWRPPGRSGTPTPRPTPGASRRPRASPAGCSP
nr:hypothetical protein GCM10020092_097190 [Actinoplanes digitatis]